MPVVGIPVFDPQFIRALIDTVYLILESGGHVRSNALWTQDIMRQAIKSRTLAKKIKDAGFLEMTEDEICMELTRLARLNDSQVRGIFQYVGGGSDPNDIHEWAVMPPKVK